jgi:hypothetical protein
MSAKLWLSRSRSRSKAQPSWAALSSTSPVQACFWGDKDGEWRWPTLQDFSSFRCLCSQPYHIHSSSSKLHTSYERSSGCCRHWIQICCYRAASRFIATRTRNSENSQSTRSSRFQLQPNPTPAQQQQSAAPHQNTIHRLLVLLLLLKKINSFFFFSIFYSSFTWPCLRGGVCPPPHTAAAAAAERCRLLLLRPLALLVSADPAIHTHPLRHCELTAFDRNWFCWTDLYTWHNIETESSLFQYNNTAKLMFAHMQVEQHMKQPK